MKIGFDLDDVLLGFFDALHPYCNSRYGISCHRKDLTSYDLAKLWRVSEKEAINRVFDFYSSLEFQNTLPVNGAVEGIKKIKQYHHLSIITARPEELKDKTLEWLNQHFLGMFDNIYFVNHYGSDQRRNKGEVCNEFGVEIFVDDSLENVDDVANFGIPALLFDAPWNQGEVKPPITRVYSWDEIVEILLK
ncbi:MAG: hypothetical protein Q8Q22_00080 [bacterium]|nr:hypothetical protein [bacterium]MDZ4205692.1 hypothetical protein [Patescibacteria group bacterium]